MPRFKKKVSKPEPGPEEKGFDQFEGKTDTSREADTGELPVEPVEPEAPEMYRVFFALDDMKRPLDTVIMDPSGKFTRFLNRQRAQGFRYHSISKAIGDRFVVIFEKAE